MVHVVPIFQGKNIPLSVVGATRSQSQILATSTSSFAHVWVLLKHPLAGPWGILLGRLDPLRVSICVRFIGTQSYTHTIPQNSTTKHYDTLVQLRLVSGRLGRFSMFEFPPIRTNF